MIVLLFPHPRRRGKTGGVSSGRKSMEIIHVGIIIGGVEPPPPHTQMSRPIPPGCRQLLVHAPPVTLIHPSTISHRCSVLPDKPISPRLIFPTVILKRLDAVTINAILPPLSTQKIRNITRNDTFLSSRIVIWIYSYYFIEKLCLPAVMGYLGRPLLPVFPA